MKELLKIIILINMILCLSKTLAAQQYQPFPTDSAEWLGGCAVFEIPFLPFHYVIEGDSIIGNKQFIKIYSITGSGSFIQKELYCGIRTDSVSKVWVKYFDNMGYGWVNIIDTNELLIYNFNLNVNDTFYVKKACHGDPTGYHYKVTYIDSVQMLGQSKRKRIFFLNLNPDIWPDKDIWIEGIGSLWHPFYNSTNAATWPLDTNCVHYSGAICNGVYCYYEDGEKMWGFDTCYPTNSIKNVASQKVTHFLNPNPFSDAAVIDLSVIPDAAEIILFDSKGLIMKKMMVVPNQKQIYFYREDFSKGLYLLEIRSKRKPSIFEKIIIY